MKTVLAVDDSKTMRMMVQAALEDAGFEVVLAEHGQDGLDKLGECEPDVIITDINMPVMNGYELISAIRAGDRSTHTPILVLTTESAPEKKQRAREAGATGWIVKPFQPAKLVEAINRVVV